MSFFKGSIFERIRKSKDAKIVTQNTGYLLLLKIASFGFPLLTMPYLAKVIGPEGFGKIAFASAVVLWFQTIADWGFDFTATRDVAQNRDNKEIVSKIFSMVLWSRCLLCIISFIVFLIMIFTIPLFRDNKSILIVTFFLIPGHILFPDWFFQAVEKMKYTTMFNLSIKFVFTVAVFAFVKGKDDYILQPLFTTIGYILCGLITLYLVLFKWGYTLYKPNLKEIYSTIKHSTDVFLNSIMPNLYNSLSIVLLGFWGGSSANGLYDGGNKFVAVVQNFQLVLSRAFFPFLARREDKHKIYAMINMSIAILFCIILCIFAPLIVKIMLTPDFYDSIHVLRILSLSLIGLALNNTYGTNYLIIRHHERKLRIITMRTSIVGFIIALPLVYFFTYIGAAITIAAARLLLGTQSFYEATRLMKQTE